MSKMEHAMDTVGGRLTMARGKMSQANFAAQLGIHRNTLANYESDDRMVPIEVLAALTNMGFNPNWVMTGRDSMRGGHIMLSEPDLLPIIPPMPLQHGYDPSEYVPIQRFNIRLSAGKGRINDQTEANGWLLFSRKYLDFIDISAKDAAIVRIKGDSMEPMIADGDTVLIDQRDKALAPAQRAGKSRCYAICRLSDGESAALQCKFVHLAAANGSEIAVVSSANDLYPAEQVNLADIEVFGRIRWHGHTWF